MLPLVLPALVCSALALCPVAAAATQDAPSTRSLERGDYAGWLYLGAAGDMPVRLHVGDAGAATLDLPAYELGNRPASIERSRGGTDILCPDAAGWRITMHLERDDATSAWSGPSTWLKDQRSLSGEVFLYRSAVALPWVPMDEIPEASGVYAIAPGEAVIISKRGWGELHYSEPHTGRSGYLIATSPTTYIAGAAAYVPTQVRARCELRLNERREVTGLTWNNGDEPPKAAPRAQFETIPLSFRSGDVHLAGQILRIAGAPPRPGLVVIGGSDWELATGLKRYAETFAALGFTVLTFDKRGHGQSGGERDNAFAVVAQDIIAAVSILKARPDVDRTVGVFGYSRAGWHIPLAASTSDAIDFALMFVPPAISPARQETTRRLAALRQQGVAAEADLVFARRYLEAMWDVALPGAGAREGERYLDLRKQIEARGWLDALEGPPTVDDDEWRWARLNMHYDPLPALRGMRCPVLAVFGGADENVAPSTNVPLMLKAFAEGGNDMARIEVIDHADHGLFAVGPGPRPRHHMQQGAPAALWPMVRAWLLEVTDIEQ